VANEIFSQTDKLPDLSELRSSELWSSE